MFSFLGRVLNGTIFTDFAAIMLGRRRQRAREASDPIHNAEEGIIGRGSTANTGTIELDTILQQTSTHLAATPSERYGTALSNHTLSTAVPIKYGPFQQAPPLSSNPAELITFQQLNGEVVSAITLSSDMLQQLLDILQSGEMAFQYAEEAGALGIPQVEARIKAFEDLEDYQDGPIEKQVPSLDDLLEHLHRLNVRRLDILATSKKVEDEAEKQQDRFFEHMRELLTENHLLTPIVQPRPEVASSSRRFVESSPQIYSGPPLSSTSSLSTSKSTAPSQEQQLKLAQPIIPESPSTRAEWSDLNFNNDSEHEPEPEVKSRSSTTCSIETASTSMSVILSRFPNPPSTLVPAAGEELDQDTQDPVIQQIVHEIFDAQTSVHAAMQILNEWPAHYACMAGNWSFLEEQGRNVPHETRTDFDLGMIEDQRSATRELIDAEIALRKARLKAREHGVWINDVEMTSCFADRGDDGYLESGNVEAGVVDRDWVEGWMDDERSVGVPELDEWDSESIGLGEAISVIAIGKEKEKINAFEAMKRELRGDEILVDGSGGHAKMVGGADEVVDKGEGEWVDVTFNQ